MSNGKNSFVSTCIQIEPVKCTMVALVKILSGRFKMMLEYSEKYGDECGKFSFAR